MRSFASAVLVALIPASLAAQVQGKFPPDSLINTQVFPHNTPVQQVVGAMQGFTGALGVRCQFCHVGQEGQPLAQFDFAKDEKQTKLIARQMLRMVREINARLDTLPGRTNPGLAVTCNTCHRGANRPQPLADLMAETATSAGADSATRAYTALRQRYYGRDAYDFGENSLANAAFQLARAGKFPEAMAMLTLNDQQFPNSAPTAVARGQVNLMKGDTTAAVAAWRDALRIDPQNRQAQFALRRVGQQP